jgi:hypothetical protein
LISAERTSKRKEVNTMTYTKPEVVALTNALASIQSTQPKHGVSSDNMREITATAYEADE